MAITGTTTGTGRLAAEEVARKGATVFLLNRKSDRSDKSLEELRAAVPDATFTAVECDLQSFDSVVAAAKAVAAAVGPAGLDVLCNNAGVMALPDRVTGDGFDVQMQTNHLSHFLLTKELFAAGAMAEEARIVQHSSLLRKKPFLKFTRKYFEKHQDGELGGDKMGWSDTDGPTFQRYQQTKAANVAMTFILQKKIDAAGGKMKALVAHPGVASTSLSKTTAKSTGSAVRRMMFSLASYLLFQSPEDGTCGILTCMAMDDVKSGILYGPVAEKGAALEIALPTDDEDKEIFNDADMEMVWEASEAAVGGPFAL